MKPAKHLFDCDKLSATKLRSKYKAEATSHRAMLDRRKDGALVADELVDFRSFLRILGPRPEKGYTVDRLNSNDPEYAAGKVKWRSKTDQSRNRRNVVHLRDSDGRTLPLAEWAGLTGQSRYTLHARKRRGLPDPEVIHGPDHAGSKSSYHRFPWPKGREAAWEEGYRRKAWWLHTVERRELRAEFLRRIAGERYRELKDELEQAVNPDPNVEPGSEHDKLLKDVDGWQRELRRAAFLLLQPEYQAA